MKKELCNIEEALSQAIKIEAYEQSVLLQYSNSSVEREEGHPIGGALEV